MTLPALIKDPYKALDYTAEILSELKNDHTWVIPQSGGKDSRSVAWAVLILLKENRIPRPHRLVTYFSDTLMEYPSFKEQATQALDEFVDYARHSLGIEAHGFVTMPKPGDDFWVNILGNGMVPPTSGMRWCTDRMKIRPPRDILKKQGWHGSPVLLGVRYGESDRRDKVLSCSVGGECGPDVILRHDKNVPKVQPIVKWAQCAVWDFLTLIAPGYGFNPKGLQDHYGPDGDLRYGCWSCPLVWNDKTGRYLAVHNPHLGELVTFTDQNFRPGGAAWKTHNRELFKGKNGVFDGKLSLRYCQQLYDWMVNYEVRHGIALLEPWQKSMIKGIWDYRRSLPPLMRGIEGQTVMDIAIDQMETKPLDISGVESKTASSLAVINLVSDEYHYNIAKSARILVEQHPGVSWVYVEKAEGAVYWESQDYSPPLWATYTGGQSIEVEPLTVESEGVEMEWINDWAVTFTFDSGEGIQSVVPASNKELAIVVATHSLTMNRKLGPIPIKGVEVHPVCRTRNPKLAWSRKSRVRVHRCLA